MSIHLNILSEEQRGRFILNVQMHPLPFSGKLGEIHSPKTLKQIRYAHSLCNALAAYKQVSPEVAKKDAKVAFGVIVVCTSIITGERTARLTSFADYDKTEMEAFITQMEVYLSTEAIPFIASEGVK